MAYEVSASNGGGVMTSEQAQVSAMMDQGWKDLEQYLGDLERIANAIPSMAASGLKVPTNLSDRDIRLIEKAICVAIAELRFRRGCRNEEY